MNIYFPGKENDVIERNEIVIVDERKYLEILKKLKDYSKYIPSESVKGSKKFLHMSPEEISRGGWYHIEYVNGNALIYDNDDEYPFVSQLMGKLINPRANLLVFMQNLKSNNDLSCNLSSIIDNHPLEFVDKIFNLSKDSLGLDETRNIIEELSPQISLFSNEVLNCIDFVQFESININEIKEKIEWCKNALDVESDYCKKIEIQKLCYEYANLLFQAEIAQKNMDVLKLSKNINKTLK